MSLASIVATTMTHYADSPALGERHYSFITNNITKEVHSQLSLSYTTVTYSELWQRVSFLAAELYHRPYAPITAGCSVAFLAFTSGDYVTLDLACIYLGAVTVSLQTNASGDYINSILNESAPLIIAVSIDHLDAAIDAALNTSSISRIVLLNYYPAVSEHAAKLSTARRRLSEHSSTVSIDCLNEMITAGKSLPDAPLYNSPDADDELSMLTYTSGSTGTPKGAMYTQKLASGMWGGSWATIFSKEPPISFHYMPMSHVAGHSSLKSTLARGGTCYFTAKSNLSTLLEDISLCRPTELSLVPRICELISQTYQLALIKHNVAQGDPKASSILEHIRTNTLGGRVAWASCSSAPLPETLKKFMETLLNIPIHNVYGSTEAGAIWIDNELLNPPVLNFKLIDAPELGYFTTDLPFPRGELLLKTLSIIPGYYKRPDLANELFDEQGYYKTGDIVAQTGSHRLEFVDRRKNILKLSQGEFIATSQLETLYSAIPEIQNIYIYGKGEWSYFLAVIIPYNDLTEHLDEKTEVIKQFFMNAIRQHAKTNKLRSYEIPRDVLIDKTPFTQLNGLLSDHGKPMWPKLRQKYALHFENLNSQLISQERVKLRNLHQQVDMLPVLETLKNAVCSLVGGTVETISPEAQFRDLGGDSISAVNLATLLSDIYAINVPVDLLISPGYDLKYISEYIEKALQTHQSRPSCESTHSLTPFTYHAKDLQLEHFINPDILHKAHTLNTSPHPAKTILLTGSSGYLGRFLALQLLKTLGEQGGTLICVVRAKDIQTASRRFQESFGRGDSVISRKVRALSKLHLEVLAGDIGEPKFGLDEATWERLSSEVDSIFHAAALVNHLLPYSSLFNANVNGTSEIISLALSHHLKPIVFLSSIAVASLVGAQPTLDEDMDIRLAAPVVEARDTYAVGYGLSKWACEVLLREANSHYGLPVTTFRSSMILAHSSYPEQLNIPDMFTRLLLSLVKTGVAPQSFYRQVENEQKPHYDGLPVDFTANAIVRIGLDQQKNSYRSINLVNSHNDGISLDTVVDWLSELGINIRKISEYADWHQKFERKLLALPKSLQQHTSLPLIHSLSEPAEVISGSKISSKRLQETFQAVSSDMVTVPHLSKTLIHKYLTDLQSLGLLNQRSLATTKKP